MTRRLGRTSPRDPIGRPRLCSRCLTAPPLLSFPFFPRHSMLLPFLLFSFSTFVFSPLFRFVLISRLFPPSKTSSSRSVRVRFNFYERLPPRSLVIACLAVTLRADSASRYRTAVASRRVECSFLPFFQSRLSFFFLSVFFLFLLLAFARHLFFSLVSFSLSPSSFPFPFVAFPSRVNSSIFSLVLVGPSRLLIPHRLVIVSSKLQRGLRIFGNKVEFEY